MTTISYMQAEERKTISATCKWFSICNRDVVYLTFADENGKETTVKDVISFSISSRPANA